MLADAFQLIKEGISKRIDFEIMIPAITLVKPFHL